MIVKTVAALARACKVSHTTAAKWLKHPTWDLPNKPPWDVAKVKAWRAANLEDDRNPEGRVVAGPGRPKKAVADSKHPITRDKERLASIRADLLEIERDKKRGDMIGRAEVEEGQIRRVYAAKAALERLYVELPPRLVGRKEHEMADVIRAAVREALCVLAGIDDEDQKAKMAMEDE